MTVFLFFFFFFFFQAEDGIRDHCVTGVQTCALPIFARSISFSSPAGGEFFVEGPKVFETAAAAGEENEIERAIGICFGELVEQFRSEERRVGKECRFRWGPDHKKKKQ